MKRTKAVMQQCTAILTGDWHLREDVPLCRLDNYWGKQWDKVNFVSALQREHNCPVLHSGDLFNHWKPSPYLLTNTIEHLPQQFWTVFGNHDLPQNNIEMRDKCGIEVLDRTKTLNVLSGYHWNQPLPQDPVFPLGLNMFTKKVLVYHTMVWQGELPWPGCTDPNASRLLKNMRGPDLILTGHNHKPFTHQLGKRLLVNPGSLMRMTADQIEFQPRVYLWYEDTNTVIPVFLPIEKEDVSVISRKHLEAVQEKENRLEAFIAKLDMDWSSEVSFRKNLDQFFSMNDVHTNVEELVWKSLEEK